MLIPEIMFLGWECQGTMGKLFQFSLISDQNHSTFVQNSPANIKKPIHVILTLFQGFLKLAPLPSRILGKSQMSLYLPSMCLLLKFDCTTVGVSSLHLSKAMEVNLLGVGKGLLKVRQVVTQHVLEFDQTFPKNHFGYQKLFFKIFCPYVMHDGR